MTHEHDATSIEHSHQPVAGGQGAGSRARMKLTGIGAELRISIALTLITMSLLGLVVAVGLWPDQNRAIVQSRSAMLEMVAISASQAASRGDGASIIRLVQRLENGEFRLRSVAARSANMEFSYESADHAAQWKGASETGSTLTHARLPVFEGTRRWGEIEVTFDDRDTASVLGIETGTQSRAFILIGLSAVMVYWLAAHLVFRKMRSSAALPDQSQLVFDAMTDAVVLLDEKSRIVTANKVFWNMTQESPEDLLGKTPDGLKWACERTSDLACLPWRETLKDGITRTRQRVLLSGTDATPRILNASAAAICGPAGNPMGVLITFDDVSAMEAQLSENASLLSRVASASADLQRKNEELQILATTDILTGCCNRRAIFDHFNRFWSLSSRNNDPLGCIMIDIDHFKLVNDKHGHAAGDKVLAEVGQRLRELVRTSDVAGRYGGEEFCVIAPETTLAQTEMLAERIRRDIESTPCGGLAITVSLGIAARDQATEGFEALIARADAGLYSAKRAGRNRVVAGVATDISKAA